MSDAGLPERPDEDILLVERALAGDELGFELLVVKYQRRIQRLIARMVRDHALVEDLAQETFIRAYRALHQFRGESRFYTWLYRIAVNTTRKSLMVRKRDPVVVLGHGQASDDENETFSAEKEPISEETPEKMVAAHELAEAVQAALQALPDELNQAITLREMEGLSYEEIARLMDSPVGTVRSRIFRAREAIASRIAPMLERRTGRRW